METAELIKFFAALFAIMNPIGNIPIFLSVTEDQSAAERARIALVASIAVALILIACLLFGQQILAVFGITIAALRAAGGLIILSIAFSLLRAQTTGIHHANHETTAAEGSPAVYPLAMPLLAGPGAISTVIVFAHGAPGTQRVGLAAVIVAMSVLLYLGMRLAGPASKLLGRAGMEVITRVMGIILAAIAVEMIAEGARALLAN